MKTTPFFISTNATHSTNFGSSFVCALEEIIGGTKVPDGQYSFMTAIRETIDSESHCGGSLITSRMVLTAAHCVLPDGINGPTLVGSYISIGSRFNTPGNKNAHHIKIQKEIIHPQYNASAIVNDVMLLILEKDVDIEKYPPIHLARDNSLNAPGTTLTVIGWGATIPQGGDGIKPSPVLLQVQKRVVDNKTCAKMLNEEIIDSTLCAGGKAGKGNCSGDSGGPLFAKDVSGKITQVGVVSSSQACGQEDIPALYSRVATFYDFIQANIELYMSGSPSCTKKVK